MIDIEPFMLQALAAGIGLALLTGPLGCFVVWRRMAYFGDALSHSALLGIALGLLMGIGVGTGIVLVSFVFAILMTLLQHYRQFASDTMLGILSHAALSIGMVAVSFMPWMRADLMSYLFGDILAVQVKDLWIIYSVVFSVLALLILLWKKLLLVTLHEDLARAEGANTFLLRIAFMLMMTLVIAVAIQVIGILLVTSLLIIPAATARLYARSPESMAVFASLFGCLAVIVGLFASLHWDTPSGPSIVVAATALFALSLPLTLLFKKGS